MQKPGCGCVSGRGCWIPKCGPRMVPSRTFLLLLSLCPHTCPQGPHPGTGDNVILILNLLLRSTWVLPGFIALSGSHDPFQPLRVPMPTATVYTLMRDTVGAQVIGSALEMRATLGIPPPCLPQAIHQHPAPLLVLLLIGWRRQQAGRGGDCVVPAHTLARLRHSPGSLRWSLGTTAL